MPIHTDRLTQIPGSRAAIGVLLKCGVSLVGEGSEPGVIRYHRLRA